MTIGALGTPPPSSPLEVALLDPAGTLSRKFRAVIARLQFPFKATVHTSASLAAAAKFDIIVASPEVTLEEISLLLDRQRHSRPVVVVALRDCDSLDRAIAIELGVSDVVESRVSDRELAARISIHAAGYLKGLHLLRLAQGFAETSFRDELTGLYNRRFFREALARELSRADRNRSPLSVVVLDLDDFKAINDRFGHPGGDKALRHIAKVLTTATRASDIAARYGGDEFAVLLSDTDQSGARIYAERVLEAMSRSADTASGPLGSGLSGSIGIASYGLEGCEVDDLMQRADLALYRSKRGRKGAIEIAAWDA